MGSAGAPCGNLAVNGLLLVAKPSGVSSFGVIETLQRSLLDSARSRGHEIRKRELPKFGHGGTLDPFATGLLLVCVGNGTKLARYFLGSKKEYRARIHFGATTIPGDPTSPVSESCETIPSSLDELRREAQRFTETPYLQVPPMHSAKKVAGQALYELAREGIEIERKPSEVRIFDFEVTSYAAPVAEVRVLCSAGTYIRVLGQDLGRRLGSLAYLETLERSGSGRYRLESAQGLEGICDALRSGRSIESLHCFVPFDRMLDGFQSIEVSEDEALTIRQGQNRVISSFEAQEIQLRLERMGIVDLPHIVCLRHASSLVAIFSAASKDTFQLDRVFL